jgi:pyrroline-5-carboxylate reductase
MLAILLDAIEGYAELTEQEMEALEEFFSGLGEPIVIDDDYIEEVAELSGIGGLIDGPSFG